MSMQGDQERNGAGSVNVNNASVQPVQQQYQQAAAPVPGKGMGVASLVLGILGLLTCLTGWGAIIGLILAIIGLILGSKARKILPLSDRGIATAGWICSIVALCICAAGLLLAVLAGGVLLGLAGLH
ncbi:MAG: hypothetical protein HDQ89_00030 [Desulfovibrio sp.]|nr:hypothetical protein [Desulfovibrio sp.]